MNNSAMTLADAITIAGAAHEGQKDKAGEPYFLHALAVMRAVFTPEQRIVAVLHDTVEDTDITFAELADLGLAPRLLEALRSVTECDGETYKEFVDRALADPIGRVVKAADIKHNMQLSRIPDPQPRDYARVIKYGMALCYMQARFQESRGTPIPESDRGSGNEWEDQCPSCGAEDDEQNPEAWDAVIGVCGSCEFMSEH